MTNNTFITKHGNPEKQHDWNEYVCDHCGCEFIADGIPHVCPECFYMLTDGSKKAHITDKVARGIMNRNITIDYCDNCDDWDY